MLRLRFPPKEALIPLPAGLVDSWLRDEARPAGATAWADSVAEKLDTLPCGLRFAIGELRLPYEPSQTLAHKIAHEVCQALIRRGAPPDMYVEIDRPQATSVAAGYQARTLLPHHDGGHCTYLTPSRLDAPDWPDHLRQFSDREYTTTKAHKLYQGIFIPDPGQCLSVTTYQDLLAILAAAYRHQTGSAASSVVELARWLGQNIRSSLDRRPQHQSRYLTLGAMLGSTALYQQGTAIHYAEVSFSAAETERFPELRVFNAKNGVSGQSPTEHYLDHLCQETLGMAWADVQRQHQIAVPSERLDLVLGHNLVLWHGGLLGGPGRVIEPICFVVDNPAGPAYESWLAQAWRARAVVPQ